MGKYEYAVHLILLINNYSRAQITQIENQCYIRLEHKYHSFPLNFLKAQKL
jgi:hypothetical protein